jgi:formamidopyrimidine-DNA glycosylase
MPELPDVENYKRYLNRTALHRRIAGVQFGDRRVLGGVSAQRLARAVKGRRIERSRRHGKHLFAALDRGPWLSLHFGMTGRLVRFRQSKDDPRFDRVRFDLDHGDHLAFVDQRILGRVGLTTNPDTYIADADLGPDALELARDPDAFVAQLEGRRGQVKAALMDQRLLAGIGNIYSDEILFQARLHPKAHIERLERKSLKKLCRATRSVLETAIDCGAGLDDFVECLPSTWLLAHRSRGADCPVCGGKIQAVKAAGRTSYYCASCQPAPAAGNKAF